MEADVGLAFERKSQQPGVLIAMPGTEQVLSTEWNSQTLIA
jgi:hypothetical protein